MSKLKEKTALKFPSQSEEETSNPKSKFKSKSNSKYEIVRKKETPNLKSKLTPPQPKNKSKLDEVFSYSEDPYDWRLGLKLDRDDLRPHNFDFEIEYVNELSPEHKTSKIADDPCKICQKSVTKCGHYLYNAKWGTYTVIFCGICDVQGDHWFEDCPQKPNYKPDWSKVAFSGVDKIPWET